MYSILCVILSVHISLLYIIFLNISCFASLSHQGDSLNEVILSLVKEFWFSIRRSDAKNRKNVQMRQYLLNNFELNLENTFEKIG